MPERNTDDPERDFALLAYVRAYLRDAEGQDFVIPTTTAIDQYVHAIVRLANREIRSPSPGGKRPAQGNHPQQLIRQIRRKFRPSPPSRPAGVF